MAQLFRRCDEIVNLHSVRMMDTCGYLRLPAESFDRLLVVDERRPQDSHGNLVAERNATGAVKRAERITAEKGLEFVATIKSQTRRADGGLYSGPSGRHGRSLQFTR